MQPALPRAGVFCSLCGFGHQAEQWGERKGAFFFALLQALIPTDSMKELLANLELYVSVDAASAALDVVVLDAALRRELREKLLASDKLQQATGEPAGSGGFGGGGFTSDKLAGAGTLGQRLPFDTVIEIVMASWEEQEQYKASRQTKAFEDLFQSFDEDGNGQLSFDEFSELLRSTSHASSGVMDEEHMLDMYDEAITAAEELTGEETDCITPAAFAMMATARGLLPPMATRFVEPLSAAAELKQAREATHVDVIGGGGGAGGGGGGGGGAPKLARGQTFSSKSGRKEHGKESVMTRAPGSPGAPPMFKSQSTSATVVKAAAKAKSGTGFNRSKSGGVKKEGGGDGAGGAEAPKTEEQLELLRSAMSSNFLFRGLDAEQLTRIMQAMIRIEVPKGKEVIKQGDKGDLFYVAERGEFEVFVAQPGQLPEAGKLIHTYVASPDEGRFPCFGELALMYAADLLKKRAARLGPRSAWALT